MYRQPFQIPPITKDITEVTMEKGADIIEASNYFIAIIVTITEKTMPDQANIRIAAEATTETRVRIIKDRNRH